MTARFTVHTWCGILATVLSCLALCGAHAGETSAGPPDLPVTGTRDFSVVQYDYLDDGGRLTLSQIQDAFLLDDSSIRRFYDETSFGLLNLDVSHLVESITNLHPPENGCYPGQSHVLIEVDEELEPDPVWLDLDHHLALVHNNCSFNVSTYGNLTGWPTLNQGTIYLPIARTTARPAGGGMDFARISSSTWAHEIGHGLGIPLHAQAYKCSANGPLSVDPVDCLNIPTGHQHDLMGSRHAATHLNGHFKDFLGWMSGTKLTVVADGCYVLDLHDLAQSAEPGQTRLIEIPLDTPIPARTAGGVDIDFDLLTLEFRGHTGFDQRPFKQVPLAAGGFRNVTSEVNAFGILAQALNCDDKPEPWYPCVPYAIDMRPDTMTDTNLPDFWDPIDGYLLEGENWAVPLNPLTISVLDTGDAPDSIEVLVEFGAAGATWYADGDGDGHGDSATPQTSCLQPAGYVADPDDCDDSGPATYPGAPEVNDGLDNQCTGDSGFGWIDELDGPAVFVTATEFHWPSQPGATMYEVARSDTSDFLSPCMLTPTPSPSWFDSDVPASGAIHHYLVRPLAPFAGSWGTNSHAQERMPDCS